MWPRRKACQAIRCRRAREGRKKEGEDRQTNRREGLLIGVDPHSPTSAFARRNAHEERNVRRCDRCGRERRKRQRARHRRGKRKEEEKGKKSGVGFDFFPSPGCSTRCVRPTATAGTYQAVHRVDEPVVLPLPPLDVDKGKGEESRGNAANDNDQEADDRIEGHGAGQRCEATTAVGLRRGWRGDAPARGGRGEGVGGRGGRSTPFFKSQMLAVVGRSRHPRSQRVTGCLGCLATAALTASGGRLTEKEREGGGGRAIEECGVMLL